MKIFHIPFGYYPDPVGGTEIYVESLARQQKELGCEVVIAAPGPSNLQYTYGGFHVCRFAVSEKMRDLRELYGEGDPQAAREFARILDEKKPDLVHLHAFTRGASLQLVRAAKQRKIPVVFTYHTPTVSCQRGTLMQYGKSVCDGKLRLYTCARCTLQGHRLNSVGSMMVGSLPPMCGRLLGHAGLSGGMWTALRMTELVQLRHTTFHALMQEVHHIVAVCQWIKDLLLRNNIPENKITVSRHGLPQLGENVEPEFNQEPILLSPLRIAYLGRLDSTKGIDILIRALRLLPIDSVKLHLYGIVQSTGGTAYLEHLKNLAAGDPRIVFCPPVPSAQVISLLRNYHILAVPSQCLETGPLVVLEAFAAGIPVIGSRRGGIAELVKHEVNGLLVEPDSIEGWCQAIQRICGEQGLLAKLCAGVPIPRKMDEVAKEMAEIYEKALRDIRCYR